MITGVKRTSLSRFTDHRGSFIKTFDADQQKKFGLRGVKEYFFSKSNKNVWRGMHLQVGQFASNRLIYCLNGAAIDFLIDLRKNSKSFCSVQSFDLKSDQKIEGVFVPSGVAHGFLALRDQTEIHYISDRSHHRDYDSGVNPYSIPEIAKVLDNTDITISTRDMQLPSLKDFLEN
jgi:dTDP-4-dehydrorhamnose 3,5-epimerase